MCGEKNKVNVKGKNPTYCTALFDCHNKCSGDKKCVWNKNFIEGITRP
jgi:hypothetical protein